MRKMLSAIVGNILSICGVALTEPQLQNLEHIMSIICMVLGLLITIVSVVIIPLIKWWKEAKKDGKIDEEEAKLICSYSPPLNLKKVPFDENQSFRAELSLLRSKHSR